MLLGEITYKVGQKHRLALPSKFRQDIGNQAVIARGFEGCLIVVDYPHWQELTKDIATSSFLDSNARQTARFLLGGASLVELDSQGRFIVPASLYEHAELTDEVVFVGLTKWVEVWSKQRWQEQLTSLNRDGSQVAQHLIERSSN